jgi:hypothetical protein
MLPKNNEAATRPRANGFEENQQRKRTDCSAALRGKPPQPDADAMLTALQSLFGPDDVIEIRAFHKGKKRTDAGYFDGEHRSEAAQLAAGLNARGAAVYVTLN